MLKKKTKGDLPMYDYRQQPSGAYPGYPTPGGAPGGYPGGYPGFPGNIEQRLNRIERTLERQGERINRLNRRLQRVERQLGIPFSGDGF